MNLMNSKSQAWFMDFAIALLLFTFTLVVYFSYTNNIQKQEQGNVDVMLKDAKSISNSLALDGYPDDWNNLTVIRIGITDDQNLNSTKLKTFKKLNYTLARQKFATPYDFFVYFVNEKGEVLNINTVCGAGYPLINTTYNIKSAYYYQDPSDSFLLDFMRDEFNADIYFGDNPTDNNDIDSLISNLSKYNFLMMEHPLLGGGEYNNFKDELNNYSSRGGLFMLSGELTASQGKELVGVDFFKKSGQATTDRNSTVNNTDQYLALNVGQNIVFAQAYYVENKSEAVSFKQLATFNNDGKNALSKWKYGNGTIYFFSDFDITSFNGNFVDLVEEAALSFIEGTCNPINLTISISPKDLVKTERYLSYKSKLVKMIVYVWQ